MSMNLFSIAEILWNMKYKVRLLLSLLCVPSSEGLPINIVKLGMTNSKQPMKVMNDRGPLKHFYQNL